MRRPNHSVLSDIRVKECLDPDQHVPPALAADVSKDDWKPEKEGGFYEGGVTDSTG